MSLFDVSALQRFELKKIPKAGHIKVDTKEFSFLENNKEINNLVVDLLPDKIYPFWTESGWSLHELIIAVLGKIGPSSLHLGTWTISEEPLRMLFKCIEKGLITDLSCLLDYRIEKHKSDAFHFAKVNSSRVKLTKIHAKLAILKNKDWHVSIMGSSNLTKNPRLETGILITIPECSQFYSNVIESRL